MNNFLILVLIFYKLLFLITTQHTIFFLKEIIYTILWKLSTFLSFIHINNYEILDFLKKPKLLIGLIVYKLFYYGFLFSCDFKSGINTLYCFSASHEKTNTYFLQKQLNVFFKLI